MVPQKTAVFTFLKVNLRTNKKNWFRMKFLIWHIVKRILHCEFYKKYTSLKPLLESSIKHLCHIDSIEIRIKPSTAYIISWISYPKCIQLQDGFTYRVTTDKSINTGIPQGRERGLLQSAHLVFYHLIVLGHMMMLSWLYRDEKGIRYNRYRIAEEYYIDFRTLEVC